MCTCLAVTPLGWGNCVPSELSCYSSGSRTAVLRSDN